MNKKVLSILATILVLAGGLFGWGRYDHHQKVQEKQKQVQAAAVESAKASQKEYISYVGVAGKTALELLKSQHTVGTKTYSFGDLVETIDGVSGTGPKYWTFYVGGKMADTGASTYVTQAGDKIEWKLEQQ